MLKHEKGTTKYQQNVRYELQKKKKIIISINKNV